MSNLKFIILALALSIWGCSNSADEVAKATEQNQVFLPLGPTSPGAEAVALSVFAGETLPANWSVFKSDQTIPSQIVVVDDPAVIAFTASTDNARVFEKGQDNSIKEIPFSSLSKTEGMWIVLKNYDLVFDDLRPKIIKLFCTKGGDCNPGGTDRFCGIGIRFSGGFNISITGFCPKNEDE